MSSSEQSKQPDITSTFPGNCPNAFDIWFTDMKEAGYPVITEKLNLSSRPVPPPFHRSQTDNAET